MFFCDFRLYYDVKNQFIVLPGVRLVITILNVFMYRYNLLASILNYLIEYFFKNYLKKENLFSVLYNVYYKW